MQSSMFAAGVEGIVSWKQLYTFRPNSGRGRDTVSVAVTVLTVPFRLDLPTPVAWATLDPHPLQRRLTMAHEPSSKMMTVDGRTSGGSFSSSALPTLL